MYYTRSPAHWLLSSYSTDVDYRNPQTLVGSGVVSFDRALGLVSSSLTIPLFSDNIAEGTEYFGLTFVAVTDETEDSLVKITPVEPTQVLVAIEDTNGMHSQSIHRAVFVVFTLWVRQLKLSGNGVSLH